MPSTWQQDKCQMSFHFFQFIEQICTQSIQETLTNDKKLLLGFESAQTFLGNSQVTGNNLVGYSLNNGWVCFEQEGIPFFCTHFQETFEAPVIGDIGNF